MTIEFDYHRDRYGWPLRTGDVVMRRRKGENGDFFRCHPGSFGRVLGFVTEDWKTRPDCVGVRRGDEWTEVQVIPHSSHMLPAREKMIQWVPAECIRLPGAAVAVLRVLWPLTRLLHRRPLDGRSTDW